MAQRIIEGKVGVIEGSRQMLVFQIWLHIKDDEALRIFRALDSESHHLPLGKVRDLWSLNALKEKDIEIKSIEDRYRKQVVEAAIQIRKKY